ncbi:3-oxoacyl-ACP reductase family protein [Pedobacter heparinus]|uniref:SDR family NAD(P)-dependent oxidoreductase n=1 Tax=Pedobacter heparinus TaxID=984 RepID=UPI00292F69A3|nr:3-oxoacyl-ACP reductase family protein [Pedobacter heparinus]
MNELLGKTALITGSLRGIGKGIALTLAEKGADIILNDLAENDTLWEMVEQIKAFGRKVYFKAADVSSKKDVEALFSFIKKDISKLDILVNNAGTSQAKDIFDISLEDWELILNTNLTSCFLCAKYAMEMMKVQGRGRIINISSVVAQQGALYGHAHYAASKSAIFGLTKTLARTGAVFGIRVNCIAPGIIETDLLNQTHGIDGVAKIAESVPLGIGQPRDIGLAAAFLAGEGGDYITGTTIDINGGLYFR